MKIKLLVARIGPATNDLAGDEIDVDNDTAWRMIENSIPPQAVYSNPDEKATPPVIYEPQRAILQTPAPTTKPKAEKTTKPKPEKAVK